MTSKEDKPTSAGETPMDPGPTARAGTGAATRATTGNGAGDGRGNRTRKVLIVSYYFPPSGGPGVQRILKFTKYLPQFGWQPLVLTVRADADYPVLDPSLEKEIPSEAKVYRSGITEFYDLYRKITGKPKGSSIDIQTVQRADAGWKDRVLRAVRGSLFIPDGRVGWYRPGVALGKQIIEEEEPDAILASGPPFTAHWIGKTLSEASGVPLVLDFRDPWTRATFYPTRSRWARRIDERLEASCVRSAAASLSVNREIRDDLIERTGDERSKWHLLPNGYDPADFEGLEPTGSPFLTISHVGSLFASRIPWTFLDVFESWIVAKPDRQNRVRLVFAGRLAPEMEQRLSSPGLAPYVQLPGYLSHRESLRLMSGSDLLLLLTSEDATSRGMLTGKVFEYLGSGTTILALAPEGEAEELLDATGSGSCVRPGDREGLLRFLDDWWSGLAKGTGTRRPADSAEMRRYSRFAQAGELASLLRKLGRAGPTPVD